MYKLETRQAQEDVFVDVLESVPVEQLPRYVQPVRAIDEYEQDTITGRSGYIMPPPLPEVAAKNQTLAALSKVASLYLEGMTKDEIHAHLGSERQDESERQKQQETAYQQQYAVRLNPHANLLATYAESNMQAQATFSKTFSSNVEQGQKVSVRKPSYTDQLGKKYK